MQPDLKIVTQKKRKTVDSWRPVDLDPNGMSDFFGGGGLTIEELSEAEEAKMLSFIRDNPVSTPNHEKAVKKPKVKKTPKEKAKSVAESTISHNRPKQPLTSPVDASSNSPDM